MVHRQIAEADLKLRAARALTHERYGQLWDKVNGGELADGADIADVRAIALHATDVAVATATVAFHLPAPPACITRMSSAGSYATSTPPASIR